VGGPKIYDDRGQVTDLTSAPHFWCWKHCGGGKQGRIGAILQDVPFTSEQTTVARVEGGEQKKRRFREKAIVCKVEENQPIPCPGFETGGDRRERR